MSKKILSLQDDELAQASKIANQKIDAIPGLRAYADGWEAKIETIMEERRQVGTAAMEPPKPHPLQNLLRSCRRLTGLPHTA